MFLSNFSETLAALSGINLELGVFHYSVCQGAGEVLL